MATSADGAGRRATTRASGHDDVAAGGPSSDHGAKKADAAGAKPDCDTVTGFAWERWRNPDADAPSGEDLTLHDDEFDYARMVVPAARRVRQKLATPGVCQPPGRPPGTS